MELKQLEAFVSIASLRSFKRAANRIHLSQPAVSLRIRALEKELNTQLFKRHGNQVQLTGAGLHLLPIADQVLQGAHELKAAASGTIGLHQRVRLGATSSIANAWLCELIKEVLIEHSQLIIDVTVEKTPGLRTQLTTGKIDVAILMGPVHEAGFRNVRLKAYKGVWVTGKNMALPEGRLSLDEIAARPIITYARDSATYSCLEEALRQIGKWPSIICTCASVSTMLDILSLNRHIGIICEACLPDDRVQRIDCDMQLPSYRYYLAYHQDSIGHAGMALADIAKNKC